MIKQLIQYALVMAISSTTTVSCGMGQVIGVGVGEDVIVGVTYRVR